MFSLSSAHEAAFRRARRDAFIEQLALISYDYLPEDAPFLDVTQRLDGARGVLRIAESSGYSMQGGIYFWLNLATLFGSGFYDDPQYAEIRPPRRPFNQPHEISELSVVYDRVAQYISEVHGGTANSLYTRAAQRFSAFFTDNPVLEVDDNTDLILLLCQVYPQKTARHLPNYAERLSSGFYAERARTLLSSETPQAIFFVAGLEMFFGHRFCSDSFKPWIGQALRTCRSKRAGDGPYFHEFLNLFEAWIDAEKNER